MRICQKQLQAYIEASRDAIHHIFREGLDRQAYVLMDHVLNIDLTECANKSCNSASCMQTCVYGSDSNNSHQ